MREVLDGGNRTKQAGLLDMGNKQMPSHFRRAGLVVDPITTNQKAAGSSPAERAKESPATLPCRLPSCPPLRFETHVTFWWYDGGAGDGLRLVGRLIHLHPRACALSLPSSGAVRVMIICEDANPRRL